MGFGENAHFHIDTAHGAAIATVDPGFAIQDTLANGGFFQLLEDFGYIARFKFGIVTAGQLLNGLRLQLTQRVVTLGFVGNAVGIANTLFKAVGHGGQQGGVFFFRLPVPTGLAHFFGQLGNHFDHRLHFLMGIKYRTQHLVFAQLLGFRLNHQHRFIGTGNHHVQRAGGELGVAGVEDVAVFGGKANAGCTHRTTKGHAGDCQCGRGAD